MSRGLREAAFWGAVVGISLSAPVLLRVAAQRLPFQGLKQLDTYVTGRA